MVLTIEQTEELLNQVAEEFPKEFYRELNGGISLLPERMYHPEFPGNEDICIMGQYCRDQMGRYIKIFYGSFAARAEREDWDEERWRRELWKVVSHEFTHHLESLGGEKGLEIKDEIQLRRLRQQYLHGEKS